MGAPREKVKGAVVVGDAVRKGRGDGTSWERYAAVQQLGPSIQRESTLITSSCEQQEVTRRAGGGIHRREPQHALPYLLCFVAAA